MTNIRGCSAYTITAQFLVGMTFWATVTRCQYNVGLCRPPLIKAVFNNSVTLEMMAEEGEYTVLFTSGLKQYQAVACARFGYTWHSSSGAYEFYSYVETDQARQLVPYPVREEMPGKFLVKLNSKDISFHYIAYKVEDVVLIYWCRYIAFADNNYDNNIWIIAAKTSAVSSEATEKAVLQLLYHEDYRSLIDNDLNVVHRPDNAVPKYLELSPCEPSYGADNGEVVEGRESIYF